VAIEDPTHRISYGLVVVVALDQHVEQRGDMTDQAIRPIEPRACTLEQARQLGEYAGRITSRGRRLSRRQADLAQGQAEARNAVHQQQHRFPLVAEMLRHGHCRKGRLAAQKRR
jgi:hypothetical protein